MRLVCLCQVTSMAVDRLESDSGVRIRAPLSLRDDWLGMTLGSFTLLVFGLRRLEQPDALARRQLPDLRLNGRDHGLRALDLLVGMEALRHDAPRSARSIASATRRG